MIEITLQQGQREGAFYFAAVVDERTMKLALNSEQQTEELARRIGYDVEDYVRSYLNSPEGREEIYASGNRIEAK